MNPECSTEEAPASRTPRRASRFWNWAIPYWGTPGAGRVAVCSPLVGFVAGLGALDATGGVVDVGGAQVVAAHHLAAVDLEAAELVVFEELELAR